MSIKGKRMIYVCYTGNLTVNSARYPNGRTFIECVTGDTPDASDFWILRLSGKSDLPWKTD